jgi:hypothetical protein
LAHPPCDSSAQCLPPDPGMRPLTVPFPFKIGSYLPSTSKGIQRHHLAAPTTWSPPSTSSSIPLIVTRCDVPLYVVRRATDHATRTSQAQVLDDSGYTGTTYPTRTHTLPERLNSPELQLYLMNCHYPKRRLSFYVRHQLKASPRRPVTNNVDTQTLWNAFAKH